MSGSSSAAQEPKKKLTSKEMLAIEDGSQAILGIDEAGRGAWAGPATIGYYLINGPLPEFFARVRDSKKVSPKKRNELAKLLKEAPFTSLVGIVAHTSIDSKGLSYAMCESVAKHIKMLRSRIEVANALIVLDGTRSTWPVLEECFIIQGIEHLWKRVRFIIAGDDRVKAIGAASILAKTTRDNVFHSEYARAYPGYGFETNVGYGSTVHQKALRELGPCRIHRRSYKPVAQVLDGEED